MVSANRAPTNFVGNISNDNADTAEFAGLIRLYSDRKVAKVAAVSEETVRLWKGEQRFPQGRNLMKLMAEFPKIAAWVNRRTGGMSNPRSTAEGFALLEQVMASASPEGRAMRARFQQIMAGKK